MNDVQRLEVRQFTFFEDIKIILTCKPKDVSYHVKNIAKKHNISEETLYYRIRTRYGKKLNEIRKEYRIPDKETLLYVIRNSESTKEVQSKLELTDWEFIGIYDSVLGVSTFSTAKSMALKNIDIQKYVPSIRDNESMIYGMRLGDGYYDTKRSAMRIEHSTKQREWLERKVQLFASAYPYVSTTIKENDRNFGKTYSWYSKKLVGSAVRYNQTDKVDMARKINSFGLFILFLDDGNLGTYGYSSVLGFAIENRQIAIELVNTLSTFGFTFKLENEHYISLKNKHSIQSYLNEMILPFESLIPDCMKYKSELKV
jgi:hypothetical protein